MFFLDLAARKGNAGLVQLAPSLFGVGEVDDTGGDPDPAMDFAPGFRWPLS